MTFLTIKFDDKYYDVMRMVFDRYKIKPDPLQKKEHISKVHEGLYDTDLAEGRKEWASDTGVYAGKPGEIVYCIKDRSIGIVQFCLNRLKKVDLITDYVIEES